MDSFASRESRFTGGLLGLLLKNGIPKRFESILMQALGLSTAFIGAGGVLKYMLVLENGAIAIRGTDEVPVANKEAFREASGRMRTISG